MKSYRRSFHLSIISFLLISFMVTLSDCAFERKQNDPVTNDRVIGETDDGRRIYQGDRGGRYYFSSTGNKVYVEDKGDRVIGKTPEGEWLYQGPQGGRYYYNAQGKKVYLKSEKSAY